MSLVPLDPPIYHPANFHHCSGACISEISISNIKINRKVPLPVRFLIIYLKYLAENSVRHLAQKNTTQVGPFLPPASEG